MDSKFTSGFQHYLVPDDDQIKLAMTTGMVALDANVLLGAYRFAPAARNELLSALEQIGNRIWIPYRAAEEFHRNRLKVMSEYDEAYLLVLQALQDFQNDLDNSIRPKIAHLANRAALSDGQRDELFRLVAVSTKNAVARVEKLHRAHGLGDTRGTDHILERFQRMFDNRTGSPLSEEEFKEAVAEAERRITDSLPPGFSDAGKSEPYGDYLVWRQTLLEAKNRKVDYLVLVTSDAKDDWYLRIKGKTVGARPELVREMMDLTSARLVMMSTASFLFHAREYLDVTVSAETIRQSEVLPVEASLKKARLIENERHRLHTIRKNVEKDIAETRMTLIALENMEATGIDKYRYQISDTVEELQDRRREAEVRMSQLEGMLAEVLHDIRTLADEDRIDPALSERQRLIAHYRNRATELRVAIAHQEAKDDGNLNHLAFLKARLADVNDNLESLELEQPLRFRSTR